MISNLHPLKVKGSIQVESQKIVVRLGKRRQVFDFTTDLQRLKAAEDAQECLRTLNLSSTSQWANHPESINHSQDWIQLHLKCYDVSKTILATAHRNQLPFLSQHTWFAKKTAGIDKYYIVTKIHDRKYRFEKLWIYFKQQCNHDIDIYKSTNNITEINKFWELNDLKQVQYIDLNRCNLLPENIIYSVVVAENDENDQHHGPQLQHSQASEVDEPLLASKVIHFRQLFSDSLQATFLFQNPIHQKLDVFINSFYWKQWIAWYRIDKPTCLNTLSDFLLRYFPNELPIPISSETQLSANVGLLCSSDSTLQPIEQNQSNTLVLPMGIQGKTLLNHFFLPIMLQATHSREAKFNYQDTWKSSKGRDKLLKSLFALKYDQLDASALVRTYGLSFYRVNNFHPITAQAIYKRYQSKWILDPCSGYAGRLLAALCTNTVEKYVGFDPHTLVHPQYKGLLEWMHNHGYGQVMGTKQIEMNCQPFEDVDVARLVQNQTFDLVFTSPPYFDTEQYSKESTQSYNRYSNYISWKTNFLHKLIDISIQALQSNGILALNTGRIADILTIDTKFYLDSLCQNGKLQAVEVLQFPLNRRPGNAKKEPIFEVILSYRKI